MRIPLTYQKIPDTTNCPLKKCVAFEKYDGTNIHWVLKPQFGWVDYGTRRDRFPFNIEGSRRFERAHPELAGVSNLWDLGGKLETHLINTYNSASEVIVFTEYLGPNSFAGMHQPGDEMGLVIFDVQIDGTLLPPEEFIRVFQGFNISRVIFQGKYSGQLFVDVRAGKYDVKEGVVVKGVVDGKIYMVKIKTNEYLERLKNSFGDTWKDYWE
jgi:hypothetical protein